MFRFEDYHEPWVRLQREITAAWEEYRHYEKRARELYDEYEELRRSKRPEDRDKAARRLDECLYYSPLAREALSRADPLLEEQKTIEREYQKEFAAATSYLQSQPITPYHNSSLERSAFPSPAARRHAESVHRASEEFHEADTTCQ